MKPFFRPQRKQRRTILEENFGFLFARATTEVFAMREKIKALKKLCSAILANRLRHVKSRVSGKEKPPEGGCLTEA